MTRNQLTLTSKAIATAFDPDSDYLVALDAINDLRTALDSINDIRQNLDKREQDLVDEMRHNGTTWAVIGALFGITKQSAHERFAH
jgi:hypothetical protein